MQRQEELARAREQAQPGIFGPPHETALSLELDLRNPAPGSGSLTAQALREHLRVLDRAGARVVAGLGSALAHRLGVAPPGLRPMAPIGSGRQGFVASQADLWLLVPGESAGAAFERAGPIVAALAPAFSLREATALFRFRDGRDLTGFHDGTANPVGDDALRTALVLDPPFAGGSFVLVQRFVHDHARFAALSTPEQSLVIGRELESDEEIESAPESAHVKRTAQESFEPPAFLWRRSMPWGTPLRHGLEFIAFMAELDRAERMLRRMAGIEDGVVDALLSYTRAETGGYYFCPPLRAGRLLLGDPAA
jgi:putative iron-dependent peroxidase